MILWGKNLGRAQRRALTYAWNPCRWLEMARISGLELYFGGLGSACWLASLVLYVTSAGAGLYEKVPTLTSMWKAWLGRRGQLGLAPLSSSRLSIWPSELPQSKAVSWWSYYDGAVGSSHHSKRLGWKLRGFLQLILLCPRVSLLSHLWIKQATKAGSYVKGQELDFTTQWEEKLSLTTKGSF